MSSVAARLIIATLTLITLEANAFREPDFVIVGAGTAGCTLASRLCTALPNAKILLLERGILRNATEERIVRAARTVFDAWLIPTLTEPIPAQPGPGINNRSFISLTGNTLGGSSAINAGQFTIPPNGTIPNWNIAGLASDDAVFRLFQKVMATIRPAAPPPALMHSYIQQWLQAAAATGFTVKQNPFDGSRMDAVWINHLAFDAAGRRNDACSAYLPPAVLNACKPNLRLIQGAKVTNIKYANTCSMNSAKCTPPNAPLVKTINQPTPCVASVSYLVNGVARTAAPRQEVLLAAGPYGSPSLLQASGVGPASVLNPLRIPIVKILPVGEQTQGRPVGTVNSVYTTVPLAPENNETVVRSPATLAQWTAGKGGPLGIAITGLSGTSSADGYFEVHTTYPSNTSATSSPLIGSGCVPNVLSRGSVSIQDKNLISPPKLTLNLLTNPTDLQRFTSCVQKLRTVHKRLGTSLGAFEALPPGVTSQSLDNPAALGQSLRAGSFNGYHFVGGCGVGRVVDRNLCVIGINGIRVIDASAIPTMPINAGPMSSVYMIAEHLAEKIATQYSCLA